MYNQPCVVYNSMLQNTLVIIFGGLWLVNIFEFKATCIDLYPKISKKKILNTGIFYLGNSRLKSLCLSSVVCELLNALNLYLMHCSIYISIVKTSQNNGFWPFSTTFFSEKIISKTILRMPPPPKSNHFIPFLLSLIA